MASANEVSVKQEPVEELDLESKIIEICRDHPEGVDDAIIKEAMPQFDIKQRVTAINRLLSISRIDLFKSGQKLLYRLKDPEAASQVKGADAQEKLVYQIIKEANNKGIWIRDIRFKSNLTLTQLNKILKNLESKKLIKAVKSVAASRKKVYMLYNLEPDTSVTGGAWYTDQDFESEFVEVLNQQCFKFLEQRAVAAREQHSDPVSQQHGSLATAQEVLNFITQLGISKVQLSVDDMETILNTLIYDGKVMQSVRVGAGGSQGEGQVIQQCHEGGAISPATCVYMKEWLDL
ncbi:hypothetical protein BaRGS_00001868 [Batillaria attramentaria]|uniref:DNA-directed RNA polymerase III subunit RPC6 n=1 Tax=Batillaria attramentaria TaxID=370345 RepID=A0ABD0M5V3_9CAEN